MIKRQTSVADVNPFFIYILGFSLALIVYQLDWSYLYPKLTLALLAFLFATFFISGALGLYVHRKGVLRFYEYKNRLPVNSWIIAITIGYILNFVYAGHIPMVAILKNQDIDYFEFGIPTFYVILSTFTSFFTVYLFKCYMVEKNKKYLFQCFYLLIFPILVFNRGAVLINLSSIFFVYLFSYKKSKLKIYFRVVLIVFIVLMGFGILGNLRTSNQIDKNKTQELSEIMLNLGEAKPDFVNSSIPKEYFWSYLYISSPLANLQINIDDRPIDYSISNILGYMNGELNFDFISKRLASIFNTVKPDNKLIAPFLTVGTVYSTSYSYLGWLGMCITFLFLMGVTFLYLIIMKPQNPYFSTGLAILNTFLLFCIFDNMFFFSGLSFQLVYPVLLSLKLKRSKPVTA
ncbi:O-antigen polymerase [Mucilaginibacter segetis]|uniref:Oligosaccharide repeat unit polymerase n=1 Tax=Mucilaginibacter segetis TaxID=2793071 RepID=A0A934UP79_9SPHI|nr:O-antigen polymerase [Mucilaginibacter segetis]MBK0381144.1 oligosaccharide repeat unit polymerase [Mucilaginibacter segetis]